MPTRTNARSETSSAGRRLASPPLQNSTLTTSSRSSSTQRSRSRRTKRSTSPVVPELWLARWHSASRHVVGLDSTLPMLEQARGFARQQGLDNVEWRAGDVYQTPFADGSFNIVTCRFAFHHFEKPALAFAEMVRLAATGGRVVVCDGLASEEPAKAEAFNAMERRRDPSTVEFRTLPYLRRLFEAAGLGDPQVQRFDLSYLASDLVARSFPANDDRAGLLAMIESTVEGDKMDVGAHWTPEGVRFAFRSAVLSAVKPG